MAKALYFNRLGDFRDEHMKIAASRKRVDPRGRRHCSETGLSGASSLYFRQSGHANMSDETWPTFTAQAANPARFHIGVPVFGSWMFDGKKVKDALCNRRVQG